MIKTTAGKLSLSVFLISSIVLVLSVSFLFSNAKKTQDKIYEDVKKQLQDFTHQKFNAKYWIGRTNAISIANNPIIQKALKENNRQIAILELNKIITDLKEDTKFKHIKIHIHTKDNHSFLRSWKLDKYGDDLNSFRKTVVMVNKLKKPITSFEIGRAGLSLRAVTPVIDKDGKHLGSLEFIQGLNSIEKAFEKQESGSFLLLMDIMSRSDDIETFQKRKAFQYNYLIYQDDINQKFLNYASKIDLKKLFEHGYLYDNEYFYSYVDVKDFQNKKLGIALISKPISLVNYAVKDAEELIYISLTIMVLMVFAIALSIIITSRLIIVSPLETLQDGLDSFFAFLNKKKDKVEKIDENISAEFGKMSKLVNSNILTVEETIRKDKIFAKKLKAKNEKIKQLLDNANQGFLYFDENMIVGGEHSKVAEEIFEQNIIGYNITHLLYEDEETQLYNEEALKDILHSDGLRQELMLSLLETNFVIKDKYIEVEYKILDNNSFMLILTDITEKKELDEKIKDEQQTLKMVVEVAITHEQFLEIKNDYEKFASSIDSFKEPKKLSELRRYIHTFKGLFAQKEMLNIVKKLHSFEDVIDKSIKNKTCNKELLTTTKDNLLEWLQLDLEILKDILGEDYFQNTNSISIPKNRIDQLYLKCQESKDIKEIAKYVKRLKYHNIKLFFRPYEKLVQQLAKRLEKDIYPLQINAQDIFIANRYEPFLKSLVHIFRNSVDHGIELPEIREDMGKDYRGLITCDIYKKGNKLHIDISDDGNGVDIENIKELIISRNLASKDELNLLSQKEIIMFIFKDNFSTAQTITDISGRGIGLASILDELYKLDGTIDIENNFTKGIKFSFTIELKDDEDNVT